MEFTLLVSCGVVLFVYMCMLFGISVITKNNGVADIGYGGGFIVLALLSYSIGVPTIASAIMTVLVVAWGLRLSARIAKRNSGKQEDFRYAAWRNQWTYFYTRSFFQIYMLQGAIIFCIALPVVLANVFGIFSQLTLFFYLGLFVWLKGMLYEAVGDWQLDKFIANPNNKGRLLTTGLWSLTRHPNYFGESLLWWGMWIMFASFAPALLAVLTLFSSPLLITYLLRYVSGVPMLETAMEKKEGWAAYAAQVPVFVPSVARLMRFLQVR